MLESSLGLTRVTRPSLRVYGFDHESFEKRVFGRVESVAGSKLANSRVPVRMRILQTSALLHTLFTPIKEPRMPRDLSNPFITPRYCQYSTRQDGEYEENETHPSPWYIPRTWYLPEEEQEEPLHDHELLQSLLSHIDEPLFIEKGGHVDLQRLLFTQERDFLMKSNGQKVKMDGLSNKYVFLYIFPLVDDYKMTLMTRELVRLRNLLWDNGCFEIVFVGFDSDIDSSMQQKYFKEYSSQMTWPFIPYEDHDARERVRSIFGFSKCYAANMSYMMMINPYCGIVDPTGKLLQSWAWEILNYYGHDAFPFTDDKIISLYKEEASTFAEGVSLKALLCTSNRDYVLSPKSEKVHIQDLEDKVVCIIFDNPADFSKAPFIEDVFEKVKLYVHRDFVPVYVCRHFTDTLCSPEYINIEDEAKMALESVGWLRIPYGDSSVRKIRRVISRRHSLPKSFCCIVGPHGSYVDFNTLNYMDMHGSEAYPFTTRRVAELKAEDLKVNFLLEDVLQSSCKINRNDGVEVVLHPDCRIPCRGGKKDTDALVLHNKRLLVLFGSHSCCELGQFLCELRLLYNKKKGTNEEFEVIYMSLDSLQSDFDESTSNMPWFVFPYGIHKTEVGERLSRLSLLYCIPAIIAFEKDGQLVGMEGNLHWKKNKQAHFPYVKSLVDYFMVIHHPPEIEPGDEVREF